MMKVDEFVATLKKIEIQFNTVYCWGTFGQKLTPELINIKKDQYPKEYTSTLINTYNSLMKTKTYYGFDCVGLIKGVLWGFNGVGNSGGTRYQSNNVPDINADTMISRCKDVTTSFNNIEVGEMVWMKGHVGIYIGDNLVIECTPTWNSGVQISALGNLTSKAHDGKLRVWTKHGKLPYIDYNKPVLNTTTEYRTEIQKKLGLSNATMKYLDNYKYAPDLYKKIYLNLK